MVPLNEEGARKAPPYYYGAFSWEVVSRTGRRKRINDVKCVIFARYLKAKGTVDPYDVKYFNMFENFVMRMNYLAEQYPEEYIAWRAKERLGI